MYHPSARDFIRISCYLLIFIAVLITGALIYVSQLQLDDYRASLEQSLTEALSQPVQIGHSSLTFSRGIALSFDNLQIGPDEKPIAKIPHITATLKIMPLFDGRIVLSRVLIKQPDIQLWLPATPTKKSSPPHYLLASLGINRLNIHAGSVKIYRGGKKPQLSISKLSAVLEGWRQGQVGVLNVSGYFDSYGAGFTLDSRVPRYQGVARWRQEPLDARLTVTNISTAALVPTLGEAIPKHVKLELVASGDPETGATFTLNLIANARKEPLANLSAVWTSTPEREQLSAVQGTLLRVPLAGELALQHQNGKNTLRGTLGIRNIPVTPVLLDAWRVPKSSQLLGGKLDSLNLEITDHWGEKREIFTNFRLKGDIAVRNLSWQESARFYPQSLTCRFTLRDETLTLSHGKVVADDLPITFSGAISRLFQQPQVEFDVAFKPQFEKLAPQLPLPAGWRLTGQAPLQLQLVGDLAAPRFSLAADLTLVDAKFGDFFTKAASEFSTLDVQGQFFLHQLQLDTATFKLGATVLVASGQLRATADDLSYQLTTAPVDLMEIQSYSPLLARLNARGTIAAEVSLQRQLGFEAQLHLDKVGAHLTRAIGDLNKTSGDIDLDRHGLTFQNLHASLGESEFILSGILSGWDDPRFSLDLKGARVRAHDLIFANRQLTLYDLDGHLDIDKNGLNFAPVKVRLESETLATVTGNVSFSHPEVHLDIQSEKANILDVINLFSGPHPPHPASQKTHRVPVRITVKAQRGTLGGLHFQNAAGVIISNDTRLTIRPLTFNSDGGWCRARVIYDYDDKQRPLKVSGHAENMDATMLHQNFFETEGLVSGKLQSDFYLEGNPAKDTFWKTAKGGISARISDGVLRKFHGLAKVFSLLNVSQLFSGKLPDMNKEGMPFTSIEGSIRVDNGVATTRDLEIESVAMNLAVVGSSNLIENTLNLDLSVMPLRTVDKIITTIPVAGWILTGKNKAFLTAHFKIRGNRNDPKVSAVPIESVSDTVIGIIRRTFGLPGKLVGDIGNAFKTTPAKKKDAGETEPVDK